MYKILYAAGNRVSSKTQLERIYYFLNKDNIKLKIAAYKISSPKHINIDYTLDNILGFDKPVNNKFLLQNNYNLLIYHQLIEQYKPDLIISDFEFYTSYVANDLGITLWQVSPLVILYGLTFLERKRTKIITRYGDYLDRYGKLYGYHENMVLNSDKNLIYSHFSDLKSVPDLKDKFEWIRPYSQIADINKSAAHNVFCHLMNNNKSLIHKISKHEDAVIFSDFLKEKYNNINIKSSDDMEEYFLNLKNCNHSINEGYGSCLADAYYNGKFSNIEVDFNSMESIVNYCISDVNQIGGLIKNNLKFNIKNNLNKDNKYLHNFFGN